MNEELWLDQDDFDEDNEYDRFEMIQFIRDTNIPLEIIVSSRPRIHTGLSHRTSLHSNIKNRIDDLERRVHNLENIIGISTRREYEILDSMVRAFQLMVSDSLHKIDGVVHVFIKSERGLQNIVVIVQDDHYMKLIDHILDAIEKIRKEFPKIEYNLEVEELGFVNLNKYNDYESL